MESRGVNDTLRDNCNQANRETPIKSGENGIAPRLLMVNPPAAKLCKFSTARFAVPDSVKWPGMRGVHTANVCNISALQWKDTLFGGVVSKEGRNV